MTRHQEPMTTRSTALLQQIEGGVLGRYRSCLFSGHDTPPAQLTLPLPSVYHLHSQFATLEKNSYKRTRRNDMPKHSHDTTREQDPQTTQSEDDWSKQVLPQLPANLQEQAMKFKAFERSRKISNASDLLRGLLAYVYTAHSFQHLSMWSVLLGIADVSANDWRKRLQKASVWLDWLLQEVLAISSFFSPALVRAGVRRILLIDGTHWKCLGPKGIVWPVHTAFDLLAGRLTQVKVTDCQEGEHLEIFDLQPGDLVVTDRANGLRTRIAFVLSKLVG